MTPGTLKSIAFQAHGGSNFHPTRSVLVQLEKWREAAAWHSLPPTRGTPHSEGYRGARSMEKHLAWRDYHLEAPHAVPMASEQDAHRPSREQQ